jgi:hypothetical protein
MKNPFEIKLKVEEDPTLWERFVQWLNGGKSDGVGQQVPKVGTNTEILLSQTQKLKLKEAVESPGERTSETTLIRRSDSGQDGLII